MRSILALILGALIGFGVALWFTGEPPFAGSAQSGGADLTLTLSDAYLTRLAAPQIVRRSNGLVSHVQISSSPGDVAYVKGSVTGASIPGSVTVSPRAVNGSVAIDVRSGHIGPIPVPAVVIDPLTSTINARIAELTRGSTYRVTGAGTTGSGIAVFLKHR